MENDKVVNNAKNIYRTLCEMLDDRNFSYLKEEENLRVSFFVGGDDIPMNFIMSVDAERELIQLLSYIPVKFEGDKKVDGAIATCQVNYYLADGGFDYDYEEGEMLFRMTVSFVGSLISKQAFEYLLDVACITVDEYNDKFLMLAKGQLTIDEFLKKISE